VARQPRAPPSQGVRAAPYLLFAMKKPDRRRGALCILAAALLAAALITIALRERGRERNATRAAAQRMTQAPAAASRPVSASEPSPSTSPSPAPSSYPDQPVSTAGAAQAVRGFLPGFLAWSRGDAPASAIKDATAAFIADARAHRPNVTPAERHEHARVLSIATASSHPPLAIVKVASSLSAPYTLHLDIVHTAHGWLVSRLEPAD